jgi:hypothetical protein
MRHYERDLLFLTAVVFFQLFDHELMTSMRDLYI